MAVVTNFIFPMMHIYVVPDLADVSGLLVLGVWAGLVKYDFLTLTDHAAAKQIVSALTDSLFLLTPGENRQRPIKPPKSF